MICGFEEGGSPFETNRSGDEALGLPHVKHERLIAGGGSNNTGDGSPFEANGRLIEGHGRLVEGYKDLKMLEKWFLNGF